MLARYGTVEDPKETRKGQRFLNHPDVHALLNFDFFFCIFILTSV